MSTSTQNLKVVIDAIDNTKKSFSSVNKNITGVQKSVGNLKTKLESMKPTFQKMATVGTVAFGAIVLGANKTIKSASDLGESINAVQVVFKDGADSILEFGKTASQTVGLAQSEYNQMATNTGALLSKTGLAMSDVAGRTNELAIRAADMASVFNTDVGDAMSAINQALRGETEAIRRYTGDVTDASLETFRLSQGIGKSVKEMTQEEKVLLRLEKIMADTAVTAGDFANTSDSLANQQRILKAETENLSASIGTSLLPVKKALLEAIRPVVEKMAEFAKNNPEAVKWIVILAGALSGLVAVIGFVGMALIPVIGALTAISLPMLAIIALVGVIVGLIAWWVINWEENVETIKWIWENFIDFLLNKWEAFKAWLLNIWNSIKDAFMFWVNLHVAIWQGMINGFMSAFNGFIAFITNALDRIKNGFNNAVETVKSIFQTGFDWISSNIIDPIIGRIEKIKDAINRIIQKAKDIGKDVGGKIRNLFGKRASGGNVTAGKPYIVGERRPEVFIPSTHGRIEPSVGGGGAIVVNISGNSFMGDDDMAEKVGDKLITILKRTQRI